MFDHPHINNNYNRFVISFIIFPFEIKMLNNIIWFYVIAAHLLFIYLIELKFKLFSDDLHPKNH